MVHRIPRRVGGAADHLMSSCLFFKAISIPFMRVQVFLQKPRQRTGQLRILFGEGRRGEGRRAGGRGANVHHVRAHCAVVRVGCDRPVDASCTQGVVPIEPSCRGRAREALFFETPTSDNPQLCHIVATTHTWGSAQLGRKRVGLNKARAKLPFKVAAVARAIRSHAINMRIVTCQQ